MKNNVIKTLTLATVMLAFVSTVSADTNEYGQYGSNTPSHSISLDKMVSSNASVDSNGNYSGDFTDNLSSTDYRFKPESAVTFKLTVKNTSEEDLNNVTIKDFLPDYVTSVNTGAIGDNVTFDSNANTIYIPVGDLSANESKTYYVQVKTAAQNNLPADKSIICVTNNSTAYADDTPSNSDSSQFCIEKQVTGVVTVPSTGPEMWALLATGEMAALGLGMFLKTRRAI